MGKFSGKKAVFFTLDILVAIVLVFLFSIFIVSNVSYTFNDSKITQLQLVAISSDLYETLYEKEYLQTAVTGSNVDVEYILDTGLPDHICSSIAVYSNGILGETIPKSGCVEQNEISVLKAPLQISGLTYIVEVKSWVQ